MPHKNLMALSFIEPELSPFEVYIAGMGILNVFGSCDLDLDPKVFGSYPIKGGECVHLVTLGHFRSCDKYTRCGRKLHATRKPEQNRSYGRSKFTLREWAFWTFSVHVTLTLSR